MTHGLHPSREALEASQRPVVAVASPAIDSLGDLAASLAADYGLTPDPWQAWVLDNWLATAGDNWANMTCGLAVPRQNGKNAALEIRELFGSIGRGEQILHTAHEVKTAQKHFRRLKYFFGQKANDPGAKFPELNALVKTVRNVNGQEAIYLKNGGSIEIAARSKNSTRGFTVDVLVMDEAQQLTDEALEALLPTTSAAPLGDPQWIYTGTPPGPSAEGEVFSRVRRDALSGESMRTCWDEWSPPGQPRSLADVDLDDRDLWVHANPAVMSGRLRLEVIEAERKRYSDDGFARERLGWWASDDATRRLISLDDWEATGVMNLPPELTGDKAVRALGVAFSKDGRRAAVAGALHDRKSGLSHVELIGLDSGDFSSMSSAALADWLYERRSRYSAVGVSGRSGALALQQDLRAMKPPRNYLRILDNQEYFTACSGFLNAVRGHTVSHPGGYNASSDPLDASVGVSDKKIRTADGAWGWHSTAGEGDEVPLEAVSVALWMARTTRRRPNRRQEALV